jgi:hypothetical protein
MGRQLLKEIKPNRRHNRLVVEVYEHLDDSGAHDGIHFCIRTTPWGPEKKTFYLNVHNNEIDELAEMLIEAKKARQKRLMELAEGEDSGDNGRGPGRVGMGVGGDERARAPKQGSE